jgi:hypothetical protein
MRYELTDFEWTAIRPFCRTSHEACRGSTTDVSSMAFLDTALRRSVARFARVLWALHDLLQPLRPLADRRHLGLHYSMPSAAARLFAFTRPA